MRLVRMWLSRLAGLFGGARRDRDFADELETHVRLEAEELVRRGHAPADARRLALVSSGGLESAKDAYRDQRGVPAIEQFVQDLRYGLRTLRRNRGYTTVIVLMLALGIGANTAIFTLIDAVVVRDLPVPHPEQLVSIGDPSRVNSFSSGQPRTGLISYPLYLDLRKHGRPLSGIIASSRTDRLDVLVDGPTGSLEHPRGRFVSDNYFAVLGVPALRGRVFDGTEDQAPGAAPVATISYGYWTRRFDRNPSVVGRTIVVDNSRLTIIGVTPPSFTGEIVGASPDIWIPASMHDVMKPNLKVLGDRSSNWLLLLGRLEPGTTLAQARQELIPFITRTIVANAPGQLGASFLSGKPKMFIDAGGRGFSRVRATFETPLVTLMIGVALLLCIVCANVANLLLARAIARGREIAVRLALGASRGRLLRQFVTESALLALLGAAAGLLVAWWGSQALLALASDGSAIPLDLSLNLRVLAFTLAVSFVAVALFGLMPAIRATRSDVASTLRANGRSSTGGALGHRGGRMPLGSMLVAAQVALSVVLLVGAAMLARSLRNVQSADVGLDRDHLVILDVDINARGYAGDRLTGVAHALRDRLAALPGVRSVSFSENGIFSGTESGTPIEVSGFVARAADDSAIALDNVGPAYAAGIGGRMVAGREFTAHDEQLPGRIAVVNQSFARFYFPNENAVGKTFHIQDSLAIEIVGVMADTRDHDLEHEPTRRAYFSFVRGDTLIGPPMLLKFAIRTSGDPTAIVEQVRKTVVAIDPMLPIDGIDPLPVLMRQSLREERLVANLASAFGAFALLLASIGLYGVMTYTMSRRTGEIGLRAALGAQQQDVVRIVLFGALRLVAIGMIVGVPIALASVRLLRSQLHGVEMIDPVSIAMAVLTLAASAIVAALVPAIRASRVSPMVALQAE